MRSGSPAVLMPVADHSSPKPSISTRLASTVTGSGRRERRAHLRISLNSTARICRAYSGASTTTRDSGRVTSHHSPAQPSIALLPTPWPERTATRGARATSASTVNW